MPSVSVEPAVRAEPIQQLGSRERASPRALRARVVVGFALVLLASVAALSAGLLVGPAHISLGEVVSAIGRRLAGRVGPVPWRDTVVVSVRLPRALVGFVVGGGPRRWRARRCRGCSAIRSPSPACSASRRAPRWAPCWRSFFTWPSRAVWSLPICAFLGAAARRDPGVRDRGPPRAGAPVHRDDAAGRRRGGRPQHLADDLRAVAGAVELRRRPPGAVLAARRARGADLGSPAAGRPGDPAGRGDHRGARPRSRRPAAGGDRRAVGGRRRPPGAAAPGARDLARGRRRGRGGGADRVRRPAGARTSSGWRSVPPTARWCRCRSSRAASSW